MQSRVLFSAEELLTIEENNLGLRLTQNRSEVRDGAFGDAIPLSHLAGAKDIIQFITLANLPNPDLNHLTELYKKYKEIEVNSTECMPRLILSYAATLNIDDAKQRLKAMPFSRQDLEFKTKRVLKLPAEVKKLTEFYKAYNILMPLSYVVTTTPNIAKELARNFNEKLRARLNINWSRYATSADMAYLLLTAGKTSYLYKSGYDYSNYPLGKVGKRHIYPWQVVDEISFCGGSNRTQQDNALLINAIFNKIRSYQTAPIQNIPVLTTDAYSENNTDEQIVADEEVNLNVLLGYLPSNLSLSMLTVMLAVTISLIQAQYLHVEDIPRVVLGLSVVGMFAYAALSEEVDSDEINLAPQAT